MIGVTSTVSNAELRLIAGPDGTVIDVKNFAVLNETLKEVRGVSSQHF